VEAFYYGYPDCIFTGILENYYIALPKVAKVGVMDVNTLFPSSSSSNGLENNNTNAGIGVGDNDGKSWWCNTCKLQHRDEFGHHCPLYKVGLPEENDPGYFGGTSDDQRRF